MSQRLYKAGLLTHLDRAALAAYCQAWGRWIEAERMLSKYGSVIKSPSGYLMQSPYLAIANKALAQAMRILTEFGMTPSSRSRIAVPAGPDEVDPFESFLRGGASGD
jgi:P27 family predicted phage terminase small subunit